MDRLTNPQHGGVRSYRMPDEELMLKMMSKLAAYEDAEENSTLMRLPCKVGDMAWGLEITDKVLCGCPVESIMISDGEILFHAVKGKGRQEIMFDINDIGKTVFLSEPEAQKALGGEVE